MWQGLPPSWAPYGTLVGDDEQLLARTVASYWTNFARGADPNVGERTPLTTEWPRARGAAEALQLNLPTLSAVSGRAAPQCEFLDGLGAIPYPRPTAQLWDARARRERKSGD